MSGTSTVGSSRPRKDHAWFHEGSSNTVSPHPDTKASPIEILAHSRLTDGHNLFFEKHTLDQFEKCVIFSLLSQRTMILRVKCSSYEYSCEFSPRACSPSLAIRGEWKRETASLENHRVSDPIHRALKCRVLELSLWDIHDESSHLDLVCRCQDKYSANQDPRTEKVIKNIIPQ